MANIGDEIVDGSVRWIVRDTRSEATTVSSGLMSASDKIKLNGYPSKTAGNSKFLREDGTWQISYTLPKATSNALGGMIVGNNLTVDGNGKVGVSLSGNANQVLKGNGTWGIIDSYTLPQASTTALGGVKIADKTGITIGSGGVISLTSASKSAIGGITFPGGTGSVLSAEGKWVNINDQINISESTLDSLLTSDKVYNLFKNHVNSNTTTQLLKDNLFLAGDGKWKPFIVNPPKQWGYIVYDGEDHVPDFSAMDTDEYTITAISANSSTVASIKTYIEDYLDVSVRGGSNRIEGRKNLMIRNGDLHAKNAGIYLLQVSPINNYVWSTKVSGWRGLTEYNDSYIGTQKPIVCHWTIRKAPNNISLNTKRAEAEFGSEVKIEYQTDSNDTVTIDSSYEDWGVIVDDTREDHSKAKTTMTEAQKKKLPFLSKDGYFKIDATTDDIDTTQKILSYVMLKRINWSTTSYYNKKLRKQINYPVFTVSSAATDNYYSKSATVKFINKRIASTLDYWEIEEDYSNLVLTNTIPRVIRLKYDSDARPTITVSNSGLLEVKLLEDIVNDVIKAKLNDPDKDFDYILKNANVTGENAYPESITLAADISTPLSGNSTTNTNIVSATKYLYDSSSSSTTAASATLLKNTQTDPEINADYNGIRVDEVKYPYLICMPLNSSSSSATKWWFYLESDYEFIASRKVKFWDDTSSNKTEHHVGWKVELYKHYRSLTLILIPKGSSGQTTVTIKSPARANFFNMRDALKMNISISPSAATPLTGKSGADPITLTGTNTNDALTLAISRFESGQGGNYYKVGDYIPFKFTQALQLDSKDADGNLRTLPTDVIYKAVLIGIDHGKDVYLHNYVGTTPSVANTKAGHFMIGKDSDNEQICIFGKKMNTSKSNSGGWNNTDLRAWLNNATEGFLSALPTQLQNNIKSYTKASATDNSGAIGHTTDKIWLMAKGEMYPHSATIYVSDSELDGVTEVYQYFKNGNPRFFYDHEDNVTGRRCWFRSRKNTSATQFVSTRAEAEGQGQETTYNTANIVLGVIPCFVL